MNLAVITPHPSGSICSIQIRPLIGSRGGVTISAY
jgi:hypothetical protein